MKAPFYFNFYNKGFANGLKIKGDFRSGTLLAAFENFFRVLARGSRVSLTINLTEVFFMDSDSMHLIKFAEEQGCEIVWDEKSFPYQRYQEKFAPHPLMDEDL